MSSASDPQWVLQRVEFALQRIEEAVGWRCSALAEFAQARAIAPSPFVVLLDRFAQTDKRTGMRCVPWVSTEPGVTLIGVRIGQRDEVLRRGQFLCLEYELPIVRTAIVSGHFVIFGKNREQLARVPIVMK